MFFNLDLLVTQIKKVKNFRQSPFLAHDRALTTFLWLPSDSVPCSGLVSLDQISQLTNRHFLLWWSPRFFSRTITHNISEVLPSRLVAQWLIIPTPGIQASTLFPNPSCAISAPYPSCILSPYLKSKQINRWLGLLMGSRPKRMRFSSPNTPCFATFQY